jgi:two-component system response regulator CpxR
MTTSFPARQHILVIDDDVTIRDLITQYLGKEGFEVETVQDGEAGIKTVRSGEHALVLLDIDLPGIDGFEVLRRIREDSSLPVIHMSGTHPEETDRTLGLSGRANDFLDKPFSLSELLARVRAILH